MAPPSNKRVRAPAAQAVKKARIVDPVAEKVELISNTISEPECNIQESHRGMLLLAMPHSLAKAVDERHEYQTQVAEMVGQVLKEYVAHWEQEVASSKADIVPLAQKTVEAMKLVEESVKQIDGQEKVVTSCKDALNRDSEVVKAAELALQSASKEVAQFDENLQVIVADKDQCQSTYNEYFIPLKNGGVDAKEVARLLKEVQVVLKKLSTESSLLSAVGPAFKKSTEARGPFDVMAIEGAEAILTKHLGELQEQIDKADLTKAEKVSAESAAQDGLKGASEKRKNSEEALKAAEQELKSLEAQHLKCLADMNTAGEASGASEALVAKKERRLAGVQSALNAFEELLTRPSVSPEPVPEEKLEAVCESSPMELATVA
jgi:chromosome segregation ATPase